MKKIILAMNLALACTFSSAAEIASCVSWDAAGNNINCFGSGGKTSLAEMYKGGWRLITVIAAAAPAVPAPTTHRFFLERVTAPLQ